MGELLKNIIDLIRDGTASWGFKTAILISLIGVIVLLDYTFDFSYNYYLNNKIDQLEKVKTLKKQYKKDTLLVSDLEVMEERVLKKKHYSERLSQLFIKESPKSNKPDAYEQPDSEENNHTHKDQKEKRSLFWMFFSSNYLIVLILPFLIFLPLYSKEGRKGNAIIGWFASLIIFGVVTSISTWVSFQIPIIKGNPIWNYILNFFIHTIFGIIVIILGRNTNGENKTKN